MPQFTYTARTLAGEDVAGTITAGSKRETLSALAERSLFPLRVEEKRPLAVAAPSGGSSRRSWWRHLTQLADLLQNGVPLLEVAERPVGPDARIRAWPRSWRMSATGWPRATPLDEAMAQASGTCSANWR